MRKRSESWPFTHLRDILETNTDRIKTALKHMTDANIMPRCGEEDLPLDDILHT